MDEELDYMSDDFITKCISNGQSDVRPGLIKNSKEQRQHELMKKKAQLAEERLNKKSTEVRQAEALEEGLKQPISSKNKGFSMLQKMGFKDGMGLGKNNSGIVEPIAINIKNNKGGLGLKPVEKVSHKKRCVESKLEKLNEKDFMAFHSKKDKERKVMSDLRKSQRACKELDFKNSISEPKETWYWPNEIEISDKDSDFSEVCSEEKEKEEEEEEISNETKLEMLTRYLRETYFYCIWCSVQFEDERDLKECPGNTRDDH